MESDQTVPQNLKVIGEGIFFFNKLSKFSFLWLKSSVDIHIGQFQDYHQVQFLALWPNCFGFKLLVAWSVIFQGLLF